TTTIPSTCGWRNDTRRVLHCWSITRFRRTWSQAAQVLTPIRRTVEPALRWTLTTSRANDPTRLSTFRKSFPEVRPTNCHLDAASVGQRKTQCSTRLSADGR